MATPRQGSSRVARSLARASAQRDFERLVRHRDAARFGWHFEYDGNILVMAHLKAKSASGGEDVFVVSLDCDSYDTWPPETKFVNPKTLTYEHPTDLEHLPVITGFPNFGLHPAYSGFSRDPGRVDQLVCFSLTRGYYDSCHSPQPHQKWTPGRHWLYSTVRVLHRALQPPYFTGRMG